MKPFYEKTRDEKSFILLAKNKRFINYTMHFHGVFEIFIVKKGNFTCICNGKTLSVCDNTIAFFDHYDLHYIPYNQNQAGTFQYIMTIPPRYLLKFNELRNGKSFAENTITDEKLCNSIISLIDEYLEFESDNDYAREAVIDLIFSQLYKKMTFVDQFQRSKDFMIIKNILVYIENNFKENISRKSIAKTLGYTETHISKTFHQYIGYSIPHYTNLLRLSYIEKNKNKKDKKLTTLIMESGFKSVQSYYRNKKLTDEFPPSDN